MKNMKPYKHYVLCLQITFLISTSFGGLASFPQYVPPGSEDVRSPCPGLNALANHGFIPHDGRNNTLEVLLAGLAAGMNIGADFTTAIGGLGMLSNPHQDLLSPCFDLDMLDAHNFPIEHDASLSRADYYFVPHDDHSFNKTVWDTVLAFVPEDDDFTVENAGKARYNRVAASRASDPAFTYTPQQFVLSYGETALYLSVMGQDAAATTAPRGYVESLFEQERLPYEQGWTPPPQPVTLASLAALVLALNVATGEELPEGLTITESTLQLAFSGQLVL